MLAALNISSKNASFDLDYINKSIWYRCLDEILKSSADKVTQRVYEEMEALNWQRNAERSKSTILAEVEARK